MDDEYNVHDDVNEIIRDRAGEVAADKINSNQSETSSAVLKGAKPYSSTIQEIVHAVPDARKDYRQALLTAAFIDEQQATRASAAISELLRYGIDITPIVDRITALCAVEGAKGGRIGNVIEALTHQNIISSNQAATKRVFGRNKSNDSPLNNG